jgi:pimeloyl-[acyl-carrier protein] methyl ester esterase
MPYIRVTSLEWHYELEGEGEPLIFLHGWGVDKRIWRQQSKHFSNLYKVLTIDLPGHGKSDWQKISLGAMAEDVRVILDVLKIRQAMIVASSMGGILALKLYQIAPEKIRNLSFVGALPKFSKSEDFPHGLDVKRIRKLHGQLKKSYPSIINIFFRSLFTKEERQSRRFRWIQRFRQNIDVPIKPALAEYLDMIEHEDLRGILKNIGVPVQFMNGTEDEICSAEAVKDMKELVPQARFDFFHKCGHFPFLSKPYEFNGVLEEFLKS